MAIFDDVQIFNDLKNFSIKDALGIAALANQLEINKGVAKTQNQIAEWNAQASLLTQQSQLAQQQALLGVSSSGNNKVILMLGALVVVGLVGYVALKAS